MNPGPGLLLNPNPDPGLSGELIVEKNPNIILINKSNAFFNLHAASCPSRRK
jgi:hypothetical protein